jgi:hypothetical protein
MGKVVVLVVGLVMFGVLAALLWYLGNRFERAGVRAAARASLWRPGEVERPDGVHVVIEQVSTSEPVQVLETREVGLVVSGAADRPGRLADLRALARDRARLLNDQAARS